MLDYTRLVAPANHAGVLVVPAPAQCAESARNSSRRLERESGTILGKSLGYWRSAIRDRHFQSTRKHLIVVGHQPEFIHAGVWAKNVVASRLAQALDGIAVHLVVDCDVPKRLAIRVPHRNNGRLAVGEVSCGALRQGLAYEHIPPITQGDLSRVAAEVDRYLESGADRSLFPAFLRGLQSVPASDWVSQMVEGRRCVESVFGIAMQDLRLQSAWWSPLAGHVILNALEFARVYNESLAAYRSEFHLRSANRPIPDLTITDGRVELPFWAYRDQGARRRVFLDVHEPGVSLMADGQTMATFSRRDVESADDVVELVRLAGGWSLRPRALMTTIWARLFLADFFIHGIGGAKYDRISDRIIERSFGFPPPPFGCVTATLYLLPQWAQSESDERSAQWRRDLIWNPQRHLPAAQRAQAPDLFRDREAAVRRSQELRSVAPRDRDARRENFRQIGRQLEEIHRLFPQLRRQAEEAEAESGRAEFERRIALDREYFFALHSRDNLSLILDQLPGAADFV